MYYCFIDESFSEKKEHNFLVAGALILSQEGSIALHRDILSLRQEYQYGPDDSLKFACARGKDPRHHTHLVEAVLDSMQEDRLKGIMFCAEACHKFVGQPFESSNKNRFVNFSTDNLTSYLHAILNRENSYGFVFYDRHQAHEKKSNQNGLTLAKKYTLAHDNRESRDNRILAFATTQDRQAHLASAADICVGALRFIVSSPGDERSKTLAKKMIGFSWHSVRFSPAEVRFPAYRRDYQALQQQLGELELRVEWEDKQE